MQLVVEGVSKIWKMTITVNLALLVIPFERVGCLKTFSSSTITECRELTASTVTIPVNLGNFAFLEFLIVNRTGEG